MAGNSIAKFGRRKERRNDTRMVVMTLVINRQGFLKYSSIHEGNMADCKTLGTMVASLSSQTSLSSRKPIIVAILKKELKMTLSIYEIL